MNEEFPTEPLPAGDHEPTEQLPDGGDAPTERLNDGAGAPAGPHGPDRGRGRRLGFQVLAGSILAAVALCGGYIALGGFDYRPGGAADPCDARSWGDPQGLEETAERFTLAAVDGAACQLGVSREELIRALPDAQSREDFGEKYDLSQSEIEDAVRSGLLRAVDDAERADALQPLVAGGLRFAIRTLPMSALVGLIENASGIFSGGTLSQILDAVDSGDLPDDLDPGKLPGRLGGELSDRLKEQLPEELQQQLPEDLREQIEKGLDDLLNP